MSIPHDLEVASAFALQVIPPQPQHVSAAAPVAAIMEEQNEETKSEDMEVDSKVQEKDSIDVAISGEKKEEGYESSDLDLSSDSSSEEEDDESSDDISDDEVEKTTTAANKSKQKQRGEMLDDEEDEVFPDGIVKTAHEIVDIVVEKPQFELTPQTEIILAGNIFQIIDNVIVIHCRPGCEFSTLDQGSLLVYENREIMGEVFETFGPVARPYYSVRFNDSKEINTEFGKIGAAVYYVPSYQKTQIVETEALRKIKGTDASNVYDEEVGEDEQEFSDDEKEMQAKKRRNREKKMRKNAAAGSGHLDAPPFESNRGGRGGRGRHNQARPPRDLPSDFDSAIAAYEGSMMPPRQQQSYADLEEYSTPQQQYHQPPPPQPLYYQQQQSYQEQPLPQPYHPTPQQAQQSNYQSPADLVSALFKSYNGQLPLQLPASASIQPSPQPLPQPVQPQPLTQPVQSEHQQQQTQQSPQQPQQAQKASIRALFAQPPPPPPSSSNNE